MAKQSQLEQITHEDLKQLWEILTPDATNKVRAAFALKQLKTNQIIYAEHDAPEYLYCLLTGKAKMYKDGIGGRQQILRLYRPIQYFGYRAYFDG